MNVVEIGNRSYAWEPNLLEIKKALDSVNLQEQNNFPLSVINALQDVLDGKSSSNPKCLIQELLDAEKVFKIREYSFISILTPTEGTINEPYYFLYKSVLNRYEDLIFTNKRSEISIGTIPYIGKLIEQYYSTIQNILPQDKSFLNYSDIVSAIFNPPETVCQKNNQEKSNIEKNTNNDDTSIKKIGVICESLSYLVFIIQTLIDNSSVEVKINDYHKIVMMKILFLKSSINNRNEKLYSPKISDQLIYVDLVCLLVFFYFNFKMFHLNDLNIFYPDFNISFNIENLKNVFYEIITNIDLILDSEETKKTEMDETHNPSVHEKKEDLVFIMKQEPLNNENEVDMDETLKPSLNEQQREYTITIEQ